MADQTNTASQKHVLVVDDNLELAQTYKELLQLYGYRVSAVHNGVDALKFIQEADVDAILCDLTMPQLEGDMFYYAAQHVRPELSQSFIFVTGNVDNPKYMPFLTKVNAPILCKPIRVDSLLVALKNLFNR